MAAAVAAEARTSLILWIDSDEYCFESLDQIYSFLYLGLIMGDYSPRASIAVVFDTGESQSTSFSGSIRNFTEAFCSVDDNIAIG